MLEREFEKLATAIRDAVTKSKEANSLATVHQVRVRRRNFSLQYRPDFQFGQFAPTRLEEDIWDWRDQERFHSSIVADLPEFKSLVAPLEDKNQWVDSFARAIASASFLALDDNKLKELAGAIGRQLDGSPLPVRVAAFIDGLSIYESPLVISDRLIFRYPIPEDVAEYVMLDEYGGYSFPPLGQTWFSVVGELVFDAENTGPAQKEFLRTVDTLRLYRVGGIASNHYKLRSPHAPFIEGIVTNNGPGRRSPFNYTFSTSDVPSLSKFLQDIAPRLPEPFHRDKDTAEKEIAYSRYTDALFHEGLSERGITSAITALEALFLENETGITHRLAQRVSLFLRILGTQPDAQSTYDKVKRGYRIRSTFIHGGSLKAEQRPQADSLAPVLLEYRRECVLAFYQLVTPKDELLRQLDRAMIDQTGVEELRASLESVVHK